MRSDEPDPEREVASFDRIERLIVDTSSLIQCERAGFLDVLTSEFAPLTVRAVVEEWGRPAGSIEVADDPSVSERDAAAIGDTDAQLVALARGTGLPVLSEDRKLTLRLESSRLDYYNAYIILLALFYRGRVDSIQFESRRNQLIEGTRYPARMSNYAERVFLEVLKRR